MKKLAALASILFVFMFFATLSHGAFFPAQTYKAVTPSPPVVTNNSASLTLPVTNGEAVNTMSATNSPTSWSITACSPTCTGYFAIDNSGNVTVTATGVTNIVAATYTITAQATNGGGSGSGSDTVTVSSGTYVGIMDTYPNPTQGWTWGWSVYSPSSSYAGNFAVVERLSDHTTATIGYDATTHTASVSQFNTFCSGTYCFVKTLYDSFGNIAGVENDAAQATLTAMPQIAVAANGKLEICATPNSSMAVPYNAAFSTAKVEAFIVAYAGTNDWNGWQPNLPTFSFTGNLSTANQNITSVVEAGTTTTFENFSTASGGVWNPGQPGVEDVTLNSAVWWENYVNTATGGGTTLAEKQGINNITARTGDTFQITQANLQGPWIVAGPASSTYQSSAYWAFGLGNSAVYAGDAYSVRNASANDMQNIFGQQMRGRWAVWDFDTSTGTLLYDGTQLSTPTTTANITRGTNVGLTLFSNTNGTQNSSGSCFQQMALINQTAANRVTVASTLSTQFGNAALSTSAASYVDPDGFTIQPEFLPNGPAGNTNAYGNYSVVDSNGIKWHPQTGGYLHGGMPSAGHATNVILGGCTPPACPTKWRWIIDQGDIVNSLDMTIESKAAKNICLPEWWGQVTRAASKHHNQPVLFIHQDGMRDDEWLVVMHSNDWVEMLKMAKRDVERVEVPEEDSREKKWAVQSAITALKKLEKYL